ncbi:MAG: orotidine-5'-phosphate decarboxylase [Bacteroidia bacterium]|nr:orotidine-5'-phosphate decarboxylase [Bacteroidia bacterium]MDW8014928.1 orotidine-5'-phosphate decarboxylase [Bacteroidia bacterium]
MTPEELAALARQKRSLLCVALDPADDAFGTRERLTPAVAESLLYRVIEESLPYAIAYKANIAFYERWGSAGWDLLKRIRLTLPSETLTIADAKRGDIRHTSQAYAEAFFDELGFDAITVHPYLGWEALEPFTQRAGKWVFVLLRTTESSPWQEQVWRHILQEKPTHSSAYIGWVWGAQHEEELWTLRKEYPEDWLLMPGFGLQGGRLNPLLPLYPALIVVGRAILRSPSSIREWAAESAKALPI